HLWCTCTPLRAHLSELRHRLLHHLAAAANRTHQAPIRVHLAVFTSRAVSQVHASTFFTRHLPVRNLLGRHYTRFPNQHAANRHLHHRTATTFQSEKAPCGAPTTMGKSVAQKPNCG